MKIFISYSSSDEEYARILERALSMNQYETWFAPKDIDGGQSFIRKIGKELSPHAGRSSDERIEEDQEQLSVTQYFILLLSANSMQSKWVRREFLAADRRGIPIQVLQIDHSPLTEEFFMMMIDTQITDCYHLKPSLLEKALEKIRRDMPPKQKGKTVEEERKRFSYEDIGIYPVSSGDPFFTDGDTLIITLGRGRFFLAPPRDLLEDPANSDYLYHHRFHTEDEVFDSALTDICRSIPIDGLEEMIEAARRKIFLQFLNGENGCYFNNEKYGIAKTSTFDRTEDLAERPVLRIEMFLTDYYTHRVMKDVCKQLAVSRKDYIRNLDFNHIGANRILFTSLGINLLLCEGNGKILLTSRSTNAAETYQMHQYSLSTIEGVSISDYDTFSRSVNVQFTVYRGLKEELGVDDSYVRKDTLKFYDLFVNPMNLELGLSCSVELKPDFSLERDIVPLHGKDEKLEVSGKKTVNVRDMPSFIENNRVGIMPQALYTLCTYLESIGVFLIDRMHRSLVQNKTSVIAKDGSLSPCGDACVWSEHFIAVFDGATPKGNLLWDGLRGDVYVSKLAAEAVGRMDPGVTASQAIEYINEAVRRSYGDHGVDFDQLAPAERLQCSVLIYSMERHEVWSFGDCMLRINRHDFQNIREGDRVFAALRAFCIQIERDRLGGKADEQELSVYGREQILPYLKDYITLANRSVPFGFDVIDGGHIHADHVKIYAVQKGDIVVMASDGYPRLFDTFEETEDYLKQALKKDPICAGIIRGTKGVLPGDQSYDDRTYVSFRVE